MPVLDRRSLRLYAVTDRRWLDGRSLAGQVQEALAGGATFVQLREKDLDETSFLEEAHALKALCAAYDVPFVINDRIDIALACDADGVHVGQSDCSVSEARRMLGSEKIVGASVQTVEQARAAERAGADYLGVGAVFSTATKRDAAEVSRETLQAICVAVNIPVVAIGGIGEQNAEQLAGTGIAGIAVISALLAQADVRTAAKRLMQRLNALPLSPVFDGVIFDADGTLFDSLEAWSNVCENYLRSVGTEIVPGSVRVPDHMVLEEACAYLQQEYDLPCSPEEVLQGVMDMMGLFYRTKVNLKPGMKALVCALSRAGIPLALATSGSDVLVSAALERFGLRGLFQCVLSASALNSSKREPLVYLHACECLGTQPARTLVFEDALYAVNTVSKAGFPTVAVHDANNSADWPAACAMADSVFKDGVFANKENQWVLGKVEGKCKEGERK